MFKQFSSLANLVTALPDEKVVKEKQAGAVNTPRPAGKKSP